MRLLIRVVAFVAVLIVGLIGIGFLLADKVHVERSAKIIASPATLYGVLNSFEKFDQWSPWADLDPNVKVEKSGPPAGANLGLAVADRVACAIRGDHHLAVQRRVQV